MICKNWILALAGIGIGLCDISVLIYFIFYKYPILKILSAVLGGPFECEEFTK